MAESLQEEPSQNGVSSTPDATHIHSGGDNALPAKQRQNSIDSDAQEMVISSLRSQVQDLFSQVGQLNNKLVQSYDRVSDLEDDLHVAKARARNSSLKISQLELERTQHLSALNTGLLVEKSHVTTELNRLMEKATEEAAQRGQAESARHAIEKEIDDLSASLFGQANTMVAEARFDKHLSERKVEEAERALKTAEEAVQLMQAQMQSMQAEKEDMESKSREMEMVMGKGKWVNRHDIDLSVSLRLFSSHAPYQEYLAFLAHLRVLHPTSPNPPAMAALLPLPFLARLLNEDSEPTVRLDLAPSLNWLSRRSVLAAIHSGQLTIEPVSAASLFSDSTTFPTSTTVAGMHSSNDNVSCALCGTPVFPVADSSNPTRPPTQPLNHTYNQSNSSWSGSFFKKTPSLTNGNSQPPSPTVRNSISSNLTINTQVYIFRLASTSTSAISSLPIPSLTKSISHSNSSSSSSPIPLSHASSSHGYTPSHVSSPSLQSMSTTIYPLCTSGWCLSRLRTTCTLWAFVRTGVVDKVWEEEIALPPVPPTIAPANSNGEKPPIPPRKRGLWGIASAIGEKAASWTESDSSSKKAAAVTASATASPLPPAPPVHPPIHPSKSSSPRRLPPPLPPAHPTVSTLPIPPPLPRRSEGRSRATPDLPPRNSLDSPTGDKGNTVVFNADEPLTSAPVSGTTAPSSSAGAPPPIHLGLYSSTALNSDLPPVPLSPIRGTHLRTNSASAPLHIARTLTPSNVPLPDSRPGTPPVLPSRTASPAAGGGAPPPLPRRAAARGVRGVGSRPTTPANVVAGGAGGAGGEVVASGGGEVVQTLMQGGVGVVLGGDKDEGKKADAGEPATVVPDRSTMVSPASDEFVDAAETATPGNEVEEPVISPIKSVAEQTSKEAEATEQAPTDVIKAPEPLSSGGLASKAQRQSMIGVSEEEKGFAAESVAEAEVAAAEKYQELKDEEERRRIEKEKEEKYRYGYVGDATWEERTWKELVRLREDMFWARVGGFKD
ncbi:hypothetical protein B0H34DRAFT_798897 [Crassisporium funariophilum]|nr:hypothetical protein B0H34DRAFT_798897 [Crassisporium funariophilum]